MVHLSNRLRSAAFLDQLVDTRLVERWWERAPIKSFLHQGLSVAQHDRRLAVSVSSRLAALPAGSEASSRSCEKLRFSSGTLSPLFFAISRRSSSLMLAKPRSLFSFSLFSFSSAMSRSIFVLF